MARPGFPFEVRRRFWRGVRSGLSVTEASLVVGVSRPTGYRWFREAGGVIPESAWIALKTPARLTFEEREEIAVRHAAGHSGRQIAVALGRDPSTISRELVRNKTGQGYRATVAQSLTDRRGQRPKPRKLARVPLRRKVRAMLRKRYSPEQIAGRLRLDFPDDAEMRVSHETIYRSIYVQGCGKLRDELTLALRTGRALRKPHGSHRYGNGGSKIKDMVMISQRPAEVEDRAVPGHWEGDLILGSTASGSAIGTLVERTTGFVILLHLRGDHTARTVADAMIPAMRSLPELLRRSLTWDQGSEMARHKEISLATNMDVYFCDPHSPWQRGSNENTNGLLRQYFPKGTDLSFHGPGILENVAAELNGRPRKRHGFHTPAEVLDRLLSEPSKPTGDALTA